MSTAYPRAACLAAEPDPNRVGRRPPRRGKVFRAQRGKVTQERGNGGPRRRGGGDGHPRGNCAVKAFCGVGDDHIRTLIDERRITANEDRAGGAHGLGDGSQGVPGDGAGDDRVRAGRAVQT